MERNGRVGKIRAVLSAYVSVTDKHSAQAEARPDRTRGGLGEAHACISATRHKADFLY